jgi:hypothetical protein
MNKVLLIGLGEVGRYILEQFSRDPQCPELHVGDIHLEDTQKKVNNAVIGAAIQDLHPRIFAHKVNLFDIDKTAELIQTIQPDVVVNASVLQTWHVIRRLPQDYYARLSAATLGAWLPVQLTLAYKLALAIRQSGVNTHYVNTSLSDLTNPVLGKIELAPTIGIGNVELIEPAIRTYAARALDVPRTDIQVKLVAHHVHWVLPREAGYRKGAPYFLKITVNGQDVTGKFDTDTVMHESVLLYLPDTAFSAVSATSAIKNVKALLSDTEVETHSPAFDGLPGGYPVFISKKGVRDALPSEISLREAIELNEISQQHDGIQDIKSDGTVVFTDYTFTIMKEMLGFECKSFKPQDAEYLAKEQMAKFKILENSLNI